MIFGDPRWFYHPVRAIGLLCSSFESFSRTFFGWFGMRFCGILTFLLVIGSSASFLFLLFFLLARLGGIVSAFAAVILLYLGIAAGDLMAHSNRVYTSLAREDISQARHDVAMLVGRQTEEMDKIEISRACVESVAENMVDGITAPLFWAVILSTLLGGVIFDPIVWAVFGSYFQKAVNTMDSMFGYKNSRYIRFGWMAARFDDLVNFLPARLSSLFIVAAAFLLRLDYKNAAELLYRDRLKSSSPNSGYPESAVAGALGIQLGGPAIYFGERTAGHLIGAGQRQAHHDDIKQANFLCVIAAFLFLGVLLVFYNLFKMT